MNYRSLKNYTSTVSVIKSISRIEDRLARAGATHIAKIYEEGSTGRPIGMIFQISSNDIPMTFKLPAKIEAVFKVFMQEMKKPRSSTKANIKAQADRTAWKILSDLIDIQVSLIQLNQVEAIEVFLPYMYDSKSDRTLFEKMKQENFKMLEKE